jgi:hypothetical protein
MNTRTEIASFHRRVSEINYLPTSIVNIVTLGRHYVDNNATMNRLLRFYTDFLIFGLRTAN